MERPKRTHYEVLGVGAEASAQEVREAYRRLARKLHPDKSPGTTREFQEINEAHEVLSDPEKRAEYDLRLRSEQGARTTAPRSWKADGSKGRRPPPIVVVVRYTLVDLAVQRKATVAFDRQVVCSDCQGVGAPLPSDIGACPACDGRGGRTFTRVLGPGFVQRGVDVCRQCEGSGVQNRRPCSTCGGPGLLVESATLSVPLDGTITDGAQMAVPGKGHQTALGRPAGTVALRFKQDGVHPVYSRHPDRPADLLAQCTVTLLEALTGTTVELPRLAGTGPPLRLPAAAIIQPDEVRRFPGEGLPTKDKAGTLHVRFKVAFPPAVDPSRHEPLRRLLADPASVWRETPTTAAAATDDALPDGWECDDGVCRPSTSGTVAPPPPPPAARSAAAPDAVDVAFVPPPSTAASTAASRADQPVQQILRLLASQYTNFFRALRNTFVRSKL